MGREESKATRVMSKTKMTLFQKMICVRLVLWLLERGKNGVIQMQMTIFLNWLLHHCFLSSFPSETTIHAGHITALRKKEVKLKLSFPLGKEHSTLYAQKLCFSCPHLSTSTPRAHINPCSAESHLCRN